MSNVKYNTKKIVLKFKKVWGDKYNYSKVEYKGYTLKVIVICPIHGEFLVTPANHLQDRGCPICGGTKKLTSNEFIENSIKKHKNEYSYNKVNYVNNREKVCIICPKHGEFWQTPKNHLKGHGCIKCMGEKLSLSYNYTINEWLQRAKKIHRDKYDYSKVEYVNAHTKVCIICSEHGEFWQTPNSHLSGAGCSKCVKKYHYTTEEWIEKAKKIHGDKYDYSKVIYKDTHTKVCIICKEHGEFWQTPSNHLQNYGCYICKESKLERKVSVLLDKIDIKYVREEKFDWLKNPKTNYPLPLDFYLPDYKIAIECQGIQHYKPIKYFGGIENFEDVKYRDKIKKELCEENNVRLIYYLYNQNINYLKDKLYGEIYNK